jgi:protein involved in polysaccharide export with SLBB domain
MFDQSARSAGSMRGALATWSALRSRWAAVLAFLLLSAAPASSTDYLIQPGDTLRIDVTGLSGMQHSMPVGLDGMIRAPLAGPIPVAGKNIHDINELLQTRLASKTLRQTSPSGEEYLVIIDPEQILISVAEYRPVCAKSCDAPETASPLLALQHGSCDQT